MKVLITGATGFVGKKLVKLFLEKKYTVNVLTRNSKSANHALGNSIKAFDWNYKTDSFPDLALENVDAIINLAGESVFSKWDSEQKEKILSSRIESTEKLLNAVAEYEKKTGKMVSSFISASAIGYYGDRKNEVLTETSEKGVGFLSDVCARWEALVLNHSRTPSTRKVCIRIGIVLGKEGGALQKMLPVFKKGLGGKLGSGLQWMSWIHVDDLVSLIDFAIHSKDLLGVVNAVAPNPDRNLEFTQKLSKAIHRPAFFVVPSFLLKIILGEANELLLSSQRVLPEKISKAGYQFHFENLEAVFKHEV